MLQIFTLYIFSRFINKDDSEDHLWADLKWKRPGKSLFPVNLISN